MKKKCRDCGKTKSAFAFHNNKGTKDGKRAECSECANAEQRRIYSETRATGRPAFGGSQDNWRKVGVGDV